MIHVLLKVLIQVSVSTHYSHIIVRTSPFYESQYSKICRLRLERHSRNLPILIKTFHLEKKYILNDIMNKAIQLYPRAQSYTFVNDDIFFDVKDF